MTKVLLSTGSLFHMGTERIFSIAEKSGFQYLELMLRGKNEGGSWDCWDSGYLRRIQQKYNLKIASLHSPIDFEVNAAEYFDKVVAFAQELEVEHIIFHLPKHKDCQVEYRHWFKEVLLPCLEKSPVTFLTENMGPKCVEQGAKAFSCYPNFCFDIAHELSTRPKDEALSIVKELKNIHQFHVSWFDGTSCHMSILENKSFFKQIFKAQPDAWRVIELRPEAFGKIGTDEKKIISLLSKTREFLEIA